VLALATAGPNNSSAPRRREIGTFFGKERNENKLLQLQQCNEHSALFIVGYIVSFGVTPCLPQQIKLIVREHTGLHASPFPHTQPLIGSLTREAVRRGVGPTPSVSSQCVGVLPLLVLHYNHPSSSRLPRLHRSVWAGAAEQTVDKAN